VNSGIESQTMRKEQRSVQLPPDIYELAEAFEQGRGVRFNRQVLAALLQFYFGDANGPDWSWLRLAVAIEKGTTSIEEVPESLIAGFKLSAKLCDPELRRRLETLHANDRIALEVEHTQADVIAMLCRALDFSSDWQRRFKRNGDDRKAAILEHLKYLDDYPERPVSPMEGR